MYVLRISPADMRRMRFAVSPLAEVAETLHLLNCGPLPDLYRGWYDKVRGGLERLDMPLLQSVAPEADVARFMYMGAEPGTTIERQLRQVADYPADMLRDDLIKVWPGAELPPPVTRLLSGGPGRLAESLWEYWQVAIAPDWDRIRATLDADVAYRAARLADGGLECLIADLHSRIKMHDDAIQVGTKPPVTEHDLSGMGLMLIPCAFAWPYLDVGVGNPWPPHVIYGARGVGNLWQDQPATAPGAADVLGELLGHSRAAILTSTALPMSTTALARDLGVSPPAVSAHLSVLRRSGLVTSWRSGRRVLYQNTPLGTSILTACSPATHRAGLPETARTREWGAYSLAEKEPQKPFSGPQVFGDETTAPESRNLPVAFWAGPATCCN